MALPTCLDDSRRGTLAQQYEIRDQSERFHWLVAPSSTVVQPSPVHTGLCTDPAMELDELVADLVLLR
jgi:hypothetical protein